METNEDGTYFQVGDHVHIKNTHLAAEDVSVAKDAPILINGKQARLADLKPGMRVSLQMSAETDKSVVVGIRAR